MRYSTIISMPQFKYVQFLRSDRQYVPRFLLIEIVQIKKIFTNMIQGSF